MAQSLKLNQILATERNDKNNAQNAFTAALRTMEKPDLFSGLKREYTPRKEGDEVFPPEGKRVQVKAEDVITTVRKALTALYDVTATKDRTNCEAFADVVVDGNTLLSDVPATHLLFIEKNVIDLITFLKKTATLDPSEDWQRDDVAGFWKTAPTKQYKTRKVTEFQTVVKADAVHPAQVKEVSNDVVAGEWATTKQSGALPPGVVAAMLARAEKLLRAVKQARAAANTTVAVELKTGDAVLGYIFG